MAQQPGTVAEDGAAPDLPRKKPRGDSGREAGAARKGEGRGGEGRGDPPAPVPLRPRPEAAPEPPPRSLPQPPPHPPAAPHPVRPPVAPARLRARHWLALLAFLALVAAPTTATVWYLWWRAADQYASELGFSIRQEEGGGAAAGLLGGLAQMTGAAPATDGEILWQLLRSQDFVAQVDASLDLRTIWSRPGTDWAAGDPVFAFDPAGSIEDLRDYWDRMVRVAHEGGSGLVTLRVLAFRPEDATAITREVLARGEAAIDGLNASARADALRHADEDLALALERLKAARAALTGFRSLHRIVDPGLDLQLQSGLIGTLEGQLAQAMIEADLLESSAAAGDPRLMQAHQRIAVIEARIEGERQRLGAGIGAAAGEGEAALAALVGDYERLQVEAEFARESWLAAMAAHDAARAGAARRSRYLAAHVPPSTATSARFPARWTIAGLVALFSTLLWAVLVLVAWSLRDRR